VDSSSCLPNVYYQLWEKYFNRIVSNCNMFIYEALRLEKEAKKKRLFDKRLLFKSLLDVFNVNLDSISIDRLVKDYWNLRIKGTRIKENVEIALKILQRNYGARLFILCDNDGISGLKKYRIIRSGLSKYFEEILIVGEDYSSFSEAIVHIITKEKLKKYQIIVVNDWLEPLIEAKSIGVRTALITESLKKKSDIIDYTAPSLFKLVHSVYIID